MAAAMVSIQDSIRQFEDLEALLRAMTDAYRGALRDAGQYAVEVEPEAAQRHRRTLFEIARRTEDEKPSVAGCAHLRSLFRGALRDYKTDSEAALAALRKDLAGALASLDQLMGEMDSEGDADRQMRAELNRLRTLQEIDDLERLRAEVRSVSESMEKCVENLNRQKRLLTAQMTAEIKALQKQVRSMARETAAIVERPGIREAVRNRVEDGLPCTVLVVCVRNLAALRASRSRRFLARLSDACMKRFEGALAPGDAPDYWKDGVLAALLGVQDCNTLELSKEVAGKLGGRYAFAEGGELGEVTLQVNTAVVHRRGAEPMQAIFDRIDQTAQLLGAR
jgi:hypothetical protein